MTISCPQMYFNDQPLIMKLINLSMSSFSYATISSSGISPPEKMFARDTYWDNLDLRFSLSPSPVTNSTLPSQLSTTSKNFSISLMLDTLMSVLLSTCTFHSSRCFRAHYNAIHMKKQLFILHEFYALFILPYGVSQITPGVFLSVNIQIQQLRKQEGDMRKNMGGCRIPFLLL